MINNKKGKMQEKQDTEKQILGFWKEKKIYEKSVKKNKNGKAFYMMDGPPYATGHIHMGTALNKILKDIAMRSQRLQGKNVFDRAGYDTHGLPIEFQIEKEIGSKSKKDIEKFGVKKFIEKCKNFATKFIGVMNNEFENLGVWMDFKNPYLTLNEEYIETIWDCFKEADKKGLLYLGKYPVHVCPRCETAVAYNEIEYAKQEDISIFVKFPLKNRGNTFLIIFTTTPWTLPGNTGVMVNPDFDYEEIEVEKEIWIMAKELVPKIMGKLKLGYTPKRTFKGKEIENLEYENPLFENLKLNVKKGYRVVLSKRYVNLEEGTGLVHCAPGHGKEDYEVGKEYGLDMPSPVNINGLLTEEAGKYANKKARIVDSEIIEDLEKDNKLIHKLKYTHEYPLCWRCKSPLLMISQPQWFLKISEIQSRLLKENIETNWIPSYMKLRMKAWLEGISDWPVSRKRYWGTPLPIWICEKCNNKIVVGSIKELEQLSKQKIKEIHKPAIDNVFLKCGCGGKMKRVEDVLDVWFDSGVSSWAALDKNEFKKFWPPELNIEGKDQIRGWWNSQMILSEIKFDRKPFENILVHGMVLDLGKRKMSKSLGNIISPQDVINKYGRDYLRYYFAKISKGEDFAFDKSEFKEIQKVLIILTNVNNFINQLEAKKGKLKIEDRWISSRFNSLIKNVTESYNNFKFPEVVQALEQFLIPDLSRTYIQIIRERQEETYNVLDKIRVGLLKLLSPIIPFITESIWQNLRKEKIVKEESVHLCLWPKVDGKRTNENLEKEFSGALEIIEKGLCARAEAEIGLKWPLAKATIFTEEKIGREIQEIISRQLNVKKVEIKKGKLKIELDTKITAELETEGYAREISRNVQALRKKAGLVKKDKIELVILTDLNLKNQEDFIKDRTNSAKILISTEMKNIDEKKYKNKKEEKIKDKKIKILFNKA